MECSYSYNRALTSITYRLYDDTSGIFTYEILCTVQPDLKLTDIDYLPLVQFIVQRDLDNICTFCNDFIDRLLYVPMPPPNYVFSMCYSLFHMIEQEFTSFSHQEILSEVNAQDLYRLTKLPRSGNGCETPSAISPSLSMPCTATAAANTQDRRSATRNRMMSSYEKPRSLSIRIITNHI